MASERLAFRNIKFLLCVSVNIWMHRKTEWILFSQKHILIVKRMLLNSSYPTSQSPKMQFYQNFYIKRISSKLSMIYPQSKTESSFKHKVQMLLLQRF